MRYGRKRRKRETCPSRIFTACKTRDRSENQKREEKEKSIGRGVYYKNNQ